MAVMSELAPGRAHRAAQTLEGLMQFRRWSIFLPRSASVEAESNAVYVNGRQQGNPQFFEQIRQRLQHILDDCNLLQVTGASCTPETGIVEALEVVLNAQMVMMGFLSNRQFHKALALGELCVEVADRITEGHPELLFWRMLARANLGDAYVRLRRRADARKVLEMALHLIEEHSGAAPAATMSRVRVLKGACHAHLGRADLEEGNIEAALGHVDMLIEDYERYIWELSDTKEDREAEATTVATAYAFRGSCDAQQNRHDSALSWFGRALKCLETHQDIGTDGPQIAAMVREDVERTECLKPEGDVSALMAAQ
ncbi:unnamed protein product [Polarella glacialis]|uniref:KIF-binding protein n=1 Tax=Polarella glacialis TaxID=89957 RepID=A0A813GKZ0_POLGL|nr:unnamed protein product [Polarella glacialis]